MSTEDLLRETLHAHADAVVPREGAWRHIQQEVAAVRRRRLWWRATGAGGAALAVAAAGVGLYALGSGPADRLVTATPAASSPPAASGPAPDSVFYGVAHHRIARFSARDGSLQGYLTGPGASDPQEVDGVLYYLQRTHPCHNELRALPARTLAASRPGDLVSGYAIGANGIALSETACTGASGTLLTETAAGVPQGRVEFPAAPPLLLGNPVFEPDGGHVDAVVRTGNEAYVERYPVRGSGAAATPASACPGLDPSGGLPTAVAGAGPTWVAVQTGTAMRVLECEAARPVPRFAVAGPDTPQALAVSPSGSAALLTDAAGRIWRWSAASDQVVELHPPVPLDQVTW